MLELSKRKGLARGRGGLSTYATIRWDLEASAFASSVVGVRQFVGIQGRISATGWDYGSTASSPRRKNKSKRETVEELARDGRKGSTTSSEDGKGKRRTVPERSGKRKW